MINEVDLNSRKDLTFWFRSADKVLEYKELENSEICFVRLRKKMMFLKVRLIYNGRLMKCYGIIFCSPFYRVSGSLFLDCFDR